MTTDITIQAIVGTPGSIQPTDLRRVPAPRPNSNEAVVSVRAFSVNRGELSLLAHRGEGWRPGQDIAGEVIRAAADGSGPPSGTRVAALVDGAGWAERVAVPTHRLAVVPPTVPLPTAAALPLAGTTALNLVRGAGPLLGRGVLVTGASGAVGGLAVQLAALAGAEVTALASAAHASRLATYGATATIDDLAVLDEPHRFEVILESVGGTTLRDALTRIAPRGLILAFGNSSGEPTNFDLLGFIGHEEARIKTYFSYLHERDARANLETVLDLIAAGRLTIDTLHVRDWEHVNETIEAMRARRAPGKAVLTVGPSDR